MARCQITWWISVSEWHRSYPESLAKPEGGMIPAIEGVAGMVRQVGLPRPGEGIRFIAKQRCSVWNCLLLAGLFCRLELFIGPRVMVKVVRHCYRIRQVS